MNNMKPGLVVAIVVLAISHVAAAADLSVNAKFQHGVIQFNDAEYSKAFTEFDKLSSDFRTNGEFNYYYGLSLLKTNQTEQAVAVMKRAIDLEPDNAEYRYALGLIYAARMSDVGLLSAAMMIGSAKKTLIKAVELSPKHVGATSALVEFLMDVPGAVGGDDKGAQDLINKLQSIDVATATALQAKLEMKKGNPEHAEKLYLQAAQIPGSEAIIRRRLSKFYLDKKEYSKAITFGEEYLSMPKRWSDSSWDTSYAHAWLAISYHALNDTVNFQKHSQAVDKDKAPKRVREEIENSFKKAGINY
jgi:tetratricopeptide (TPR) repeat protein